MTAVPEVPAEGVVESASTARVWHAVTAAAAGTALLVQVVLSISGGIAPTAEERLANLVSFFTIQSNVLVLLATASLALRPDRDGTWWRVLRLASTVGITVTGIVYLVALRGVLELQALEVWTDVVFHYLVPAMAVVGWVAFGPRLCTDWRTLLLALLWPVAWLVYTLVRGELVSWYPYPFLDVAQRGYGTALLNALLVTMLMLVVGAAYLGADRWLARRRPLTRGV